MATARFVQKGDNIDYTAPKGIEYYEVVPLASCVGVALEKIDEGKTGALSLTGVYEMPAATGASFQTGEAAFWDANGGMIVKAGTGVPAGIIVADKRAVATTALVRLCPAPFAEG